MESFFGKKDRRSIDRVKDFGTLVGADSTFIGTLKGKDNYAVYGIVEGNCDLEGALLLGPSGRWKGDIVADVVFVAGQVEGNITAREKLEVAAGSRVTGKLHSASIAISEGAVFEGEVHMVKTGQVTRFEDRRGEQELLPPATD